MPQLSTVQTDATACFNTESCCSTCSLVVPHFELSQNRLQSCNGKPTMMVDSDSAESPFYTDVISESVEGCYGMPDSGFADALV